jgi:hypothetical protein
VLRLTALGQSKANFRVLALPISPVPTADGVLGLDFLRGHLLTIDFRTGQIDLA